MLALLPVNLSLLGLVSSFAGAVLIDFRCYINLGVGLLMALMGLGLGFALVSSPCASPVLFTVLTMVSYSRGYTLLIFLASLITGLAKRSRLLLEHGDGIVRFGSLALIGTGLSYLWIGARWSSGG
jgi:cytochrome c-type biogenesis protein